jgi:single-strand DNA-binding protein
MNNCILMAEICDEPLQRYTPDGMELAEMMVQFPSTREEEPPHMLKVVGWGRIAGEIKQNYHKGDKVILEGRLGMNTIQRREGFKEKQAELNLQRIYPLVTSYDFSSAPSMGTPSMGAATPATTYEGNPGTTAYGKDFSYQSNEQQRNVGNSANAGFGVAKTENYQQPAPQTGNLDFDSYPGLEQTNYESSRSAVKPGVSNANNRSQEKATQPTPPPPSSQSNGSDDFDGEDDIPF